MSRVTGPLLAVQTCARRLSALGAARPSAPDAGRHGGDASVDLGDDGAVDCAVSWHGPARLGPERSGRPGSEASVQALSGLMAVHGRDDGRPVRMGLEVGSVAAGLLAAQAVLAGLIGKSRGRTVARVETSVLQATLLMLSHYVAAATAVGEVVPGSPGPAPGPPFPTSDGRWFEIEVFDPEAWTAFWARLGAADADLGRAWTSFRARYYRGTCRLPPGLHEAAAARTLAEATAAAEDLGVSLCPLRGYDEVLAEPGWRTGDPSTPQQLSTSAGVPGGPSLRVAGALAGAPLEGITVVEATSRMQGPLAGLLLQMLGADVVRVEPRGGDVGRMVPPLAGDTGSFFLCFNRGKRTVELDLGRADDRSELMALTDRADVFLHNWRPGKAAEWGLDTVDLAGRNDRLVYVAASGWGGRAEDQRLIGTDFLVQAYGGLGNGLRPEGEPPFPSRALVTDFMGAVVTCEGVLGGLYGRERRGRGCRVETSLLQGAMALQSHVLDPLAAGREQGRRHGRPVWGPLDRPVECADGAALVVSADDEATLGRLLEVCEIPAGKARADAEPRLVEVLRSGPAGRWEELLAEAGVPCAVAATDLAALPADPRLAHLFEPLSARCRAPASPWAISS